MNFPAARGRGQPKSAYSAAVRRSSDDRPIASLVAVRSERIDEVTRCGERALRQPSRPCGRRRLQGGHYTQAGQNVIGSHGR